MDTPSCSLNIPVSSVAVTGSSSRNKVSLKPGRSLMDWIRFTNSGKDLSSTGGKVLEVSPRELAKHNTVHDAWIALRGKVYNITHYLDYHPGGEDELMRGAGKDATDLFNQVHRWVNAESMLQKCFIGVLKKPWSSDVLKFSHIKPYKNKKTTVFDPDNLGTKECPDNDDIDLESLSSNKMKWSILPLPEKSLKEFVIRSEENNDLLKLLISCSCITQQGLVTDLVKNDLFIKLKTGTSVIFFNIALSDLYQEHYKVSVQDSILELLFKKYKLKDLSLKMSSNTINHCIKPCINWKLYDCKDEYFIYWSCKLISKTSINYNTLLLTFLLPAGTKMWIPVGCHVQIKCLIEGSYIMRSYTPVCSSLKQNLNYNDSLDSSKIVFMIKIYPSGTLTPIINRCNLGDSLYISNYSGKFSESFLESSDSIIMLAAGTGITPMIRIIYSVVVHKDVKRSLRLLFFNKTEEDIIWRKELDDCSSVYQEFQIVHILSEPSEKWSGHTGIISKDILAKYIAEKSSVLNERILVCGSLPFVQAAMSFLEEMNINQDDIYAFTGS